MHAQGERPKNAAGLFFMGLAISILLLRFVYVAQTRRRRRRRRRRRLSPNELACPESEKKIALRCGDA